MWWNICGSSGNKDCAEAINIVKKKMTPSQIKKAQEMSRNWKPKKWFPNNRTYFSIFKKSSKLY
jgi:hypothetical protein